MQSKLHLLLAGTALVAGTAVVTANIVGAQDPGAQPPDMAKMMEMATPGDEHEMLAAMAGSWQQEFGMTMMPGMPEMKSKGESTIKPLLGGRYIMEEVHLDIPMMGPMDGIQIMGFDKMSGQYVSIWLDSMGTWPTISYGKANDKGVIETKGMMKDVMSGERPFRMTIQPKGDDESYAEMFDTIEGKEVRVMTIHSQRK